MEHAAMIGLAWHTARARATSLAGSFVALALGVALLAAMALCLASTVGSARHPRWFTRAGVVVAGNDTVSVTSGSGHHRRGTRGSLRPRRAAVPAARGNGARLRRVCIGPRRARRHRPPLGGGPA